MNWVVGIIMVRCGQILNVLFFFKIELTAFADKGDVGMMDDFIVLGLEWKDENVIN